MLNKIWIGIAATILIIVVFVGGFYLGTHAFATIKSTSILQDNYIQSTHTMSALNYLDEGKVELARQYLVQHLDSTILSINSSAEDADNKSYNTACNILAGIAKHRKGYPLVYSEYSYPIENQQSIDIRKEVSRILRKWESCKKK